jgi:acyl carrier protein
MARPTKSTIVQDIRQFVITSFMFGKDAAQLANNDSFLHRGIIDSTGILELIGFLEERYAIQVTDDELLPENLDSVDQVAGFVERKLAS